MPRSSRGRKIIVGVYRLLVLALLCGAIFASARRKERVWDEAAILAKARERYPAAVALSPRRGQVADVLGPEGEVLARVTPTSPASDAITGYYGSTHLLVFFDLAGRVSGVEILQSADTRSHVARIREDQPFWQQWLGRKEGDLPEEPLVVSGATLSSEAIAKAMRARFLGESSSGFFAEEPSHEDVQALVPEADSWRAVPGKRGCYQLLAAGKNPVGYLLRSGPSPASPRGFNAPHDVWLILDATGEVVQKVHLADSRDNEPYLGDVREELKWSKAYRGKRGSEIAGNPEAGDRVLVVSGATVTSGSVAETVKALLREWLREEARPLWWQGRDWAILLWLSAAGLLAWSRWKGKKAVRWALEGTAIAVGGLWLGALLGMGSLVGWSRDGLPWANFPGLVLLAGVALLVPVATGKNFYCARLCAHGALQGLLFRATRRRWVPGPRLHRILKQVRWLLLVAVLLAATTAWQGGFSEVEPFEVWSLGLAFSLPAALWLASLVVAPLVPQAYCKYGCPTGYLLENLTASRSRLTRRDLWAGGLAGLVWIVVWWSGRGS
ncbi:FMN-binding protein [Roseibacillus ishigakijimensis]|uniref:FMN-binding protein n=1 Tax=Roseibacillus ishigakijimensis TaxID=454146 RepID=A0A934VGM6_9BACT|nr:FMN-binding protein [Roseibacillus ishigakijimensis]MBK1833028.1 FMN-binding protein [Roseibacillus ishigakijimensis]